jgi:thiamine biosynthesis lipoprotein
MNRRSFLKLTALLPAVDLGWTSRLDDHHFAYESVIGTSLDLVVRSPSAHVAEGVSRTIREEIDRLASILDTRNPTSEISRLESSDDDRGASRELTEVLRAYEYWERRTGGLLSIRSAGAHTPRNVDALGKAYIVDRAAAAARKAWPSIEGLMLDVGGDIVVWGRSREIGIADPDACYDNGRPITTINLRNLAVATSGTYARGAHLINARSGQAVVTPVAATVVAADAVTANALATTLCLTSADEGVRLVEATAGAEGLRIASGVLTRTSGFALLERPGNVQTHAAEQPPAASNWPRGYQVAINLPLTSGKSSKRPYVAVWVEDSSNKLVRVLAIWVGKSKYYSTLSTFWGVVGGNFKSFRPVTRATRSAGSYDLVWDGLDNDRKAVPLGSYRITVETNQEDGTYAKQVGTIDISDSPASTTLPATTNFGGVVVKYGPA